MQTEITISVSPKAASEKESIKLCSARKLNIDLSLRPQNLDFETYYKLVKEYESLRS